MKTSLTKCLVLIVMAATGVLPAMAAVPPEATQPIQCSQPDPRPSPGQPAFSCQDNWGLDQIDLHPSDPSLVDNAYHYRWTGQGVHVYVLDSGIHLAPSGAEDPGNGEEFGGRIGNGYSEHTESGVRTTNDCSPNSHGTRVASVIGGNRYGVAKGVTLYPVKYSRDCRNFDLEGFVRSLRFIRNEIRGALQQDPGYLAVVNVSTNIPKLWGNFETAECLGDDGTTYVLCFDLIHELVNEIIDFEVPVVVSAGNYDNRTGTPSDFLPSDVPRAFVIGGVTRDGSRWVMDGTEPDYAGQCDPGTFDPDHPQCGSNYGPEIDLWAPAEFIRSAYNAGRDHVGRPIDETIAESLGVLSGTSFAAPHVTGAIAIYLEGFKAQNGRRPTVDEVWGFLEGSAVRDVLTDIGAGSPNLLLNTYIQVGPRPADDSSTTPSGTQLTILYSSLLANDRGAGLAVVLDGFSDPPHGTLQICCNPAGFRYTPDPGYVGPDNFTYTVEDDFGLRDEAVIHITVTDQAPIAVADSVVTEHNTPITIPVLANDSDPEGGPLTVTQVTQPSNGSVVINSGTTVTYTPPTGFSGSVTFTYTVRDSQNVTATGNVTVQVRAQNVPPMAVNDSFSSPRNAPFNFTCAQLLANDTDSDANPALGDRLTVTGVGPACAGTLVCSNCSCTLTPPVGFTGLICVPYTISDNRPNGTASAVAQVNFFNRAPVAVNDTASTPPNTPVTINVRANDSDPDGDPITVNAITAQPAAGTGTCAVASGGTGVIYTPPAGFQAQTTCSYTVSDGLASSAAATITIYINRPPIARGDQLRMPYGFQTQIGRATLLANDYDPDGNTLTIASFDTTGMAGTLSCSTGSNFCTYTPPPGFTGVTRFNYTATDSRGGSSTATVKLKVGVVQSLPVANDDLLTTTLNTPLPFTILNVLANDTDADGDVLNAGIISGPRDYGTMSCSTPTYHCTYTPNTGFIGIDRFLYEASDGADGAGTASIKILVQPPWTPAFDAREDQLSTPQNMPRYFTKGFLKANDYSPTGDPLTITSYDTTGLNGTLDCTSDPNGCTYRPPSYFAGFTRFKYTVSDTHGHTDTAIVRIKVGINNAAPVAANDSLTTRANTPVRFSVFDLLKNDVDAENDPLQVTVYPYPSSGTVSCSNPNYWCTYTPSANFTGTVSFTYIVSDGIAYSNQATVTVTIQPVLAKDAQILSQSVPVSMLARQSYPVSLTLKNVGTQTWSPIGPQCNAFRFGSVNPYDNTTWGPARVELPAAVAPGGEVTLNFTVTAPSTPGTYNFQRRMVHECVEWFGDLSPNVSVIVSP